MDWTQIYIRDYTKRPNAIFYCTLDHPAQYFNDQLWTIHLTQTGLLPNIHRTSVYNSSICDPSGGMFQEHQTSDSGWAFSGVNSCTWLHSVVWVWPEWGSWRMGTQIWGNYCVSSTLGTGYTVRERDAQYAHMGTQTNLSNALRRVYATQCGL